MSLSKQFLRNNIREQLKTKFGARVSFTCHDRDNIANYFPFLSTFPSGLINRDDQLNFNSSLVKWFQSLNGEAFEFLEQFVQDKGNNLTLSNKLKAHYRKFCKSEGFAYAL